MSDTRLKPHGRNPFAAIALVLALAAGVAVAGCAREERALSPSGYVGAELPKPLPKPAFTLTATDGRAYDFRRETDGRLTLLFFGYTHCPDVCPVHLANLSAVLRKLPVDVTRHVKVVFVTTDPARDTPERIRRWLDAFDQSFVGLTGTAEELKQAQLAAGVLPAQADSVRDSTTGDYTVGHAAQIIAYTPDDLGRVMYPFGTRQADWAHDLPRLVRVGLADR